MFSLLRKETFNSGGKSLLLKDLYGHVGGNVASEKKTWRD